MNKRWFNTEIKKNVQIDGFAVENIPSGVEGTILAKGFVTSFEARFFSLIDGLCQIIDINPNTANNILIVIDSSNTAKVYREKFPLSLRIRAKYDIKKLQAIEKKDIIDLSEISFSDSSFNLNPLPEEKVIWLFRYGFVFGLYFDLSRTLRPEMAKKEMAFLMRKVIYFDLYNRLEDNCIEVIIKCGWFPFIQIIGSDHVKLFSYFADYNQVLIEDWCDKTFTNDKIETITSKWFNNNFL